MMKRILQMPIRDAKGGITQYALRNWALINKRQFLFDWVTLDKKLSFEEDLISQGCHVYHLSCRQEENEACFKKEMEAILSKGYDAIHLHTSFWRGFLAEELALKANVRQIIVHAHSTGIDNSDPKERERLLTVHNRWKREFLPRLATHFVACSESAGEFLFGSQIPKNKIVILRNGIDTNKFKFNEITRKSFRCELGLKDQFVLLQVGRLEYQKNAEFSIEVYSEYIKRNPNTMLLIAGKGSLEPKLRELARPLGKNVRFLGFCSNIPALLMAADVFLQPSYFEGFSIASIEAQCSGIPYIVGENVAEAALPAQRMTLPLEKEVWVEALDHIYKMVSRNPSAAEELRKDSWDIHDSIKGLERLYGGE